MASDDVIELGSSDDDAEPAPKKKKPMPNAMVVIPNKHSGITIKPSHPNQFRKHKDILNKPIFVNKSVSNINSNVHRKKIATGSYQSAFKDFANTNIVKTAIPIRKRCVNPLSVAKNLIKPVPTSKTHTKGIKNKTEAKGTNLINNLPPGITIKLVQNSCGSEANKNKIRRPQSSGEVLTVEIDDEDTSGTSTSSPQWYIRPEDQVDDNVIEEIANNEVKMEPSIEEQNNKEPENSQYVEITIEDSPLKPLHQKHDNEIGKELPIIIEDSPAKITCKPNNGDSDCETNSIKDRQSKKKLDYPKENNERQVVEIEIDLMGTSHSAVKENYDNIIEKCKEIEIKDTQKCKEIETKDTQKCKEIETKDTQKCKEIETIVNRTDCNDTKTKDVEKIIETKESVANSEFHPVYQNFIDMCFKLENSDDMKKIVDKKIKAYYKQCRKEYVESIDFIDMVSSKIVSMKADPEKMYLYIKDVVDELNLERKMAKSTIALTKDDIQQDSMKTLPPEPGHDSKKMRQIRKLEKTIKKLHRAIQKLENQVVDFDDEEDSVYLLTERYKERMVRVHKKFCQLTNTKMPSEPRIHIESRPGRPTGPARRLEKWINKKVPIGAPLPFPDFHDVLRCVRDANDDDRLGWNDYDIMEEARDLFTRCGKKLQRRRQENEWRLAASRITEELDPAEDNVDLKKRLDENKSLATSKELALFNKFADKQNQLKLEAVEIGDKEADESPLESDEEEEEVESNRTAEDKQKRKEKIEKLLQEKGKKTVEKENDMKSLKETKDNTGEESSKKHDQLTVSRNDEKLTTEPDVESHLESENVVKSNEDIDEIMDKTDQKNDGNESESDKVESDIDELHLYQKSKKCPEEDEDSSTLESSDTLESESELETDKKMSDIISIEDSSYSESETTYNRLNNTKIDDNLSNVNCEVEYSCTDFVEECIEKQDNVLLDEDVLEYSDEEQANKDVVSEIGDTCINLKDDNISISETTIDSLEQDSMINSETNSINNETVPTTDNNNELDTVAEDSNNSENNMTIQECSEEDETEILKNTSPKDSPDVISMENELNGNTDDNASVEMETDMNEVKDQFENCSSLVAHEIADTPCEKILETVQPIS